MNLMEQNLSKYLKNDEILKIRNTNIGIAGCGGIGSNTANNLVRLGFKNFILIDFDKIEYSNLNRQFYFYDQVNKYKSTTLKENLLKINPDLNITALKIKLTKENIKQYFNESHIIIEGFDTVENKKMLIEELFNLKPIISTSGLGTYWNVESIISRDITKNLTMIGDSISDTDKGDSPLSPGVSIVSGKIAAAVLKLSIGGNNV